MAYYCIITSIESPDSSPNHFSVARVSVRDVDLQVIRTALVGLRYPA